MKNFDSSHIKKFQNTWNKIGREKECGDQEKVLVYTILMEYHKTLEQDIKHENKKLLNNNTSIQNPNYKLLEAIKEIIDALDSKLRISFYPKKVKRER